MGLHLLEVVTSLTGTCSTPEVEGGGTKKMMLARLDLQSFWPLQMVLEGLQEVLP